MNPFGSKENIMIEGVSVKVPVINDRRDSLSPMITFQKPIWMPDNEADFCLNCNLKFSQLRRKHHCRNCGKIFCYKCCSEKMPLPHFGMNEPERVCGNCKLTVDLLWKSKSDDLDLKLEAISGFSSLMMNTAGLCKVIECGGIHIMLSMTSEEDLKLKCAIAAALHEIAQNMTINTFLVEAGALKGLKKLLMTSCGCDELISDCLSALNSMSMDPEIRVQVLKEGIVDCLLNIMTITGTLAIFAARVLQLLISNFDCHEYLIQKHGQLVPRLFQALENEDYQMQTCVTKMLAFFSAGSDAFRHLILQEDISKEFPLLFLLKGSSINVLVNAVCVVANLSLSVNQNFAHKYISALCDLLKVGDDETGELWTHLGRGLANFAENSTNALQLIHHLGAIVSTLLKSNFEVPKVHACRLIIYLFAAEHDITLEKLSESGMDEFMEITFNLPGITDILNSLLLRKVSRLSICR